MRTDTHATERLQDRLTQSERLEVGQAVKAAVQMNGGRISMAVYATRLPSHRALECGSNGQNVVAIVRNGVLRTVMLRRDNQPPTRTALRVDLVIR